MNPVDLQYLGLPWKSSGRTREGLDCVGLTWLWLTEQLALDLPAPKPDPTADAESIIPLCTPFDRTRLTRGDVILFRCRGQIRHVAVYLGEGKVLNMLAGLKSRVENGFTLIERLGFHPSAVIPQSAIRNPQFWSALSDPKLGWATVALLALAVALSAASGFLLSKPSSLASNYREVSGKYGANNVGLVTQKNPELPLPDLLGSVVVAGNAIYQQLPDKNLANSNTPPQMWNLVVVLASGPVFKIDPAVLQINGLTYTDKSFHNGANLKGISVNPPQDKANATSGSISGDTYVPSVTLYPGTYDFYVPGDDRCNWDRSAPVYRMNGCAYMVFRLADSTKFQNFNVNVRVLGRLCRQYTAAGFTTALKAENLAGADGTQIRFRFTYYDVIAAAVTVNGVEYSELGPDDQVGNVYQLNRTKGYVEFLNPPPAGAVIAVQYYYYPRVFTQNPADHLAYLLTEPRRGKGFTEDRIDWAAWVAARDYYNQTVTHYSSTGLVSGPRYQTNYAIDVRRPIQDHLQALLDTSHSLLFLVNGKFYLRPIKSEASVFSFDPSNILLNDNGSSTFEAEQADRAPKANRIRIAFQSSDTLNAETEVVAEDVVNQASRAGRAGDNGVVEEQLKFPALTSHPQAERLAWTLLRERIDSNWVYTWRTNIQGLALLPGDVVDVSHPSLPIPAKLVRIENLEFDEHDHLKLTASEYTPAAYV